MAVFTQAVTTITHNSGTGAGHCTAQLPDGHRLAAVVRNVDEDRNSCTQDSTGTTGALLSSNGDQRLLLTGTGVATSPTRGLPRCGG